MKDFRSLTVWEKSHLLTLNIYKASMSFPSYEHYGLTSQLRRSAVSVPSNIAEGCGRGSDVDFARFMQIAMGSACEVDYQLLLAKDLGFLQEPAYLQLNQERGAVKRMLTAFLKRLRPQ